MAYMTIDGWEISLDTDFAITLFRLITAIITAGAVETITFRASVEERVKDPEPLTYAVVITPTTRVRIHIPADVASLSQAGDIAMLTRKYGISHLG